MIVTIIKSGKTDTTLEKRPRIKKKMRWDIKTSRTDIIKTKTVKITETDINAGKMGSKTGQSEQINCQNRLTNERKYGLQF
jgi:hypothetical protein